MVNNFLSKETRTEDKGTVQTHLFIQEVSEHLPHARRRAAGERRPRPLQGQAHESGREASFGNFEQHRVSPKALQGVPKLRSPPCLPLHRQLHSWSILQITRSDTLTFQCPESTVSTKKSLSLSSESSMTLLRRLGHTKV